MKARTRCGRRNRYLARLIASGRSKKGKRGAAALAQSSSSEIDGLQQSTTQFLACDNDFVFVVFLDVT